MLRFQDILFDCVEYTGYKPCRFGNECRGCAHYQQRDSPATPVFWAPAPASLPDPKRTSILIIKTGALGDVLRTTTLLAPLKRKYPNNVVTWITDRAAVPLLRHNPYISNLYALQDAAVEPLIDAEQFDLLINLEKEKDPLALSGRVRARYAVGYAPTAWNTPTVFNAASRHALVLGVNDELKFRGNTASYPEIIAGMVELEFQRDEYVLELGPGALEARAALEAQLAARSSDRRRRIGLNTGCGTVFRTKQWPRENWIDLARSLVEAGAGEVILMGGPAERELNAAILQAVPELVDSGCDNPLEQFFGVIDACDAVVTSDTLGMHVAIARRKWVVALFGSTSHVEIDLFDRGEKIITDFPCSPCYKKTCDFDPWCMGAMKGSDVAQAVIRGLAQAIA